MKTKVALVELEPEVDSAFSNALSLIGAVDDFRTEKENVIVKVGVFNPKQGQHTTIPVTRAITENFPLAPQIFLAESDNYRGTGTERLQIWQELFSDRVVPFNLTEDTDTRSAMIAGEEMALSNILFKPNVLVSTHTLRRYKRGSVLKNLLGLVPMRKKARLHKNLETVILDLFEVVGGVDLGVVDATVAYPGPGARIGVPANLIIVGRDAVAVEAVSAAVIGLIPSKMPIIQEATNRGLGEGDLDKIEIVGTSLDLQRKRVVQLLRALKRK